MADYPNYPYSVLLNLNGKEENKYITDLSSQQAKTLPKLRKDLKDETNKAIE
jgi:hypothetical protein